MTPRERVDAALCGEMPDAVPFTVYECMLPKSEAERQLRNEGLCIVERSSVFKTVYSEVSVERTLFTADDGDERIRTVVKTPEGTLTAIDKPAGFTSWHEKRLFSSPNDYEPLECMIRDRTYVPDYERFAELQELMGDDASVRGQIGYSPLQEIIYGLMGVMEFAVQWGENRDRVMRLYDALVEDRRKIYEVVAHSPAHTVNYGGNVSPEVVGLDRFERMIMPHYEEAAEVLHQHGKLMGVHFDANTKLLAPAIARSKMDYVEAFTPYPDCDMTVAEAREAWPDKTLWINFPSSVHLQSVQDIEDMTRHLLREAAPGNRFIIGITEDLPPGRCERTMLLSYAFATQRGGRLFAVDDRKLRGRRHFPIFPRVYSAAWREYFVGPLILSHDAEGDASGRKQSSNVCCRLFAAKALSVDVHGENFDSA